MPGKTRPDAPGRDAPPREAGGRRRAARRRLPSACWGRERHRTGRCGRCVLEHRRNTARPRQEPRGARGRRARRCLAYFNGAGLYGTPGHVRGDERASGSSSLDLEARLPARRLLGSFPSARLIREHTSSLQLFLTRKGQRRLRANRCQEPPRPLGPTHARQEDAPARIPRAADADGLDPRVGKAILPRSCGTLLHLVHTRPSFVM
jgi:hypothetical protein